MKRNGHNMHEYVHFVRRRAADRERKRMVDERNRRMRGNRSLQHIQQAIVNKARKVVK